MSDRAPRRIVLLLEYDGSRFAGSQYQENAVTIQSTVEDAIEKTTGERVRAAFAGRTDAGAHAKGQVASFLSETALEPTVLRRALNGWLPEDVVVRAVAETEADFDARRHAVRRHYRYIIDNRDVRPALGHGYAWSVRQPLDASLMAEAAGRVVGTRDFAPFASPLGRRDASTVRSLYCFSVAAPRRVGVTCDLAANAFLPRMVRRLVGALVEVGLGRLTPAAYAALLDGPAASAGPTAPPHGLYLMSVDYGRSLFGH